MKRVLDEEFAGWKIQDSQMLSSTAQERWRSEKPLSCPGVAAGRFSDSRGNQLALLISKMGVPNPPAKLLIFESKEVPSKDNVNVVQQFDEGASDLFIHTQQLNKFFDKKSVERFRARGVQVIVLIDAGRNEYEARAVFWNGEKYRQEPVDY